MKGSPRVKAISKNSNATQNHENASQNLQHKNGVTFINGQHDEYLNAI